MCVNIRVADGNRGRRMPIEVFVGEVYESKTPNDPAYHFDAEDSV
jgi:hypothetical protein